MGYECYNLIVSVTSLLFVFIGGCFALWQWHKGLVYRRAEIVNSLIKDTMENGDVSLILDSLLIYVQQAMIIYLSLIISI